MEPMKLHDRDMSLPGLPCLPKNLNTSEQIELLEEGLAFAELLALREHLDMPMDTLGAKLGLAKATLHRRKSEGRFTVEEGDRILRFGRLFNMAFEVFGNEEDARHWLKTPALGLGQVVPLDYAATEIGAREVEDLLGRIDYGVYS